MGVETILEKIRQKSDQECREILETARQQSQQQSRQVLEQARQEAQATVFAAQKQTEQSLLGQTQQLRLEGKIALLNQKKELLEQLKQKGLEAFGKLEPAAWHALYFRLVKEQAMTGSVAVCCTPDTAKRYSLKENCRVWQVQSGGRAAYTLDTGRGPEMGIWLVGETYDVDLSAQALLDQLFEEQETKLADCLFGQKAGEA